MKKWYFSILLCVGILFSSVSVISAETDEVNWDGKTEETLKISNKLRVQKLEDGRVKPVNSDLLVDLKNSDLDLILEFMGYKNAQSIPQNIKVDMISSGGKAVESNVYNLIVEEYDKEGNMISEEVIDLNEVDEQQDPFLLMSLPSNDSHCFSLGGCFSGSLIILYNGKSGSNFQYAFYYHYNWNQGSPYWYTDRVGLAWSADGKKKAGSDVGSHNAYVNGSWIQKTMSIRDSNIYGTVLNVPMFGADRQYGSQKVDVYYPDRNIGDIEIIQGSYAHNWQSIFNGITIGPASVNISGALKQFKLERNFTVGGY